MANSNKKNNSKKVIEENKPKLSSNEEMIKELKKTAKNVKNEFAKAKDIISDSLKDNTSDFQGNVNKVKDNVSKKVLDGKAFNKGDSFDADKEVAIYCWKYVEEQKENESSELSPEGIVLPKEGSKLANDYDSKSKTTIYYMNVDGKTNKPTIKQWGKATVTDSVGEYLDYLKSLGYNIEITDVTNKEPYSGFHTYESKYKVTKGTIIWTMYHLIQDEKYVEYQFDIYFKK